MDLEEGRATQVQLGQKSETTTHPPAQLKRQNTSVRNVVDGYKQQGLGSDDDNQLQNRVSFNVQFLLYLTISLAVLGEDLCGLFFF